MVVRVGKALLEDKTFTLLGLKRGNLCQNPSTVLRWDGEAICSYPVCLSHHHSRGGAGGGEWMKTITAGKGHGDRHTCTDYASPLLEALRMF